MDAEVEEVNQLESHCLSGMQIISCEYSDSPAITVFALNSFVP